MRHAGRHAAGAVEIVALTALGLVGNAVIEDLLVLRSERGFLPASPWLGLIEGRLASRRLAGPNLRGRSVVTGRFREQFLVRTYTGCRCAQKGPPGQRLRDGSWPPVARTGGAAAITASRLRHIEAH
jgi:hypothetical protein